MATKVLKCTTLQQTSLTLGVFLCHNAWESISLDWIGHPTVMDLFINLIWSHTAPSTGPHYMEWAQMRQPVSIHDMLVKTASISPQILYRIETLVMAHKEYTKSELSKDPCCCGAQLIYFFHIHWYRWSMIFQFLRWIWSDQSMSLLKETSVF